MKEREHLISLDSRDLSIRKQCDLLAISRSTLYYEPKGESELNLRLMRQIDELILEDPTLGALGMTDELSEYGFKVNVKRVRRLMRLMGVQAIYPKKNLSKLGKAEYIRPYLLRNLDIVRPNQVWAIDISYIPMHKGFMYLTAIIDVYSRFIVGWQVSNSMEKQTQTALLKATIEKYGKPEVINSDQGSQYTSEHWVSFVSSQGIAISMDGKGRATDNAFIERFFRTVKQKHIYLNPAKNGLELHQGIAKFISRYNDRKHQGIGRVKPKQRYQRVA
jgi:putative transposase